MHIDLRHNNDLSRIEGAAKRGVCSPEMTVALITEIRRLRALGSNGVEESVVREYATLDKRAHDILAGYLANGGDKRMRPKEYIEARILRAACAETIAFDLAVARGLR